MHELDIKKNTDAHDVIIRNSSNVTGLVFYVHQVVHASLLQHMQQINLHLSMYISQNSRPRIMRQQRSPYSSEEL